MKDINTIDPNKSIDYMVENAKILLQKSDLTKTEIDKIINRGKSSTINKAFSIYFKAKGIGQGSLDKNKSIANTNNALAPNAPYQPKFTINNMSPCPIDYTVFIKTELGGCTTVSDADYYTSDALLTAPVGETSYTNGFASFGNHTWYPNNETTQQLVEQGLTAYYDSVKYLVGTNCSNTSLSICSTPLINAQSCNGCSGGANFYIASINADMDEDNTSILF